MATYDETYDPLQTSVQDQLEPYSDSSQQLATPTTPAMTAPTGYPVSLPAAAPAQPTSHWYDLPSGKEPLTLKGMYSSPLSSILSGVAMSTATGREMLGQHFQQQNVEHQQDIQKQHLAFQQKAQDRQGLQQFFSHLENASKIPAGPMRQAALKTLNAHAPQFLGAEMPPEILKAYQNASDEEVQALNDSGAEMMEKFPEMGGKGVGKLWSINPELAIKWMSEAGKLLKARGEADKAKALKDALSGAMEPSGAQPSPSMPAQPQGQPGGSQGPSLGTPGKLTPVQQQIITEAQKQGVDPAAALAFYHQESPTGAYGDGGKAAGFFQLHEPAAIDAGKALGMAPEARHTPQGNIALGVQYVGQKMKQGSGDIGEAGKFYNWGTPDWQGKGVQAYPQQIAEKYAAAKLLLGGRPVSEAVATASPEVQGQIAKLNQEITTLSGQADRIRKIPGPDADKIHDNIMKAVESRQRDVERLTKAQEPKNIDLPGQVMLSNFGTANPSQLTDTQRMALPGLVRAEEAKRKAEESGATKQDRIDIAEASNANQVIDNVNRYRDVEGNPAPVGSTRASLKAAGTYHQVEPMSDTQIDQAGNRKELIINLQELATNYGTISTGPISGRIQRFKQALGVDVKDEVTGQRLLLEKIKNDKAFDKGGKTLTANEINRVLAELPQDTDVPEVFRVKLNKALQLTTRYAQQHNAALRENGVFVPKTWDAGEPTLAQAHTPGSTTTLSEPDTGPTPTPTATAKKSSPSSKPSPKTNPLVDFLNK